MEFPIKKNKLRIDPLRRNLLDRRTPGPVYKWSFVRLGYSCVHIDWRAAIKYYFVFILLDWCFEALIDVNISNIPLIGSPIASACVRLVDQEFQCP